MNSLTACIESVAPRMGFTLLHSLWQGAVIALVLALVLQVLRSASSTLRYALCCLAMLLLVASVAGTFAVLAPKPQAVTGTSTMDIRSPVVSVTLTAGPSISEAAQPVSRIDPIRWAGIAWMMGTSVVALWHLAGWLWIVRCVRGNQLDVQPLLSKLTEMLDMHRVVRMIESSMVSVPAVVGVIRPVILIPLGLMNDLPPDQVEAILLHELAHIRRHDYLVNLLQAVVESLLFYHPATWWISSQIRRERENCCDDIAASRFAGQRYASALLALEELRWPLGHFLVGATGGDLLHRVQRLLGRGGQIKIRPVRSAVAAILSLVCIFVPLAVVGQSKPVAVTEAPATSPASDTDIKFSPIVDEDLKPDEAVTHIGPSDLVQVTINDLTGPGVATVKQSRVSDPGGAISLPLLNEPLKIDGMTEAQVQQAVIKAYRDANIIPNAMVQITRTEARSSAYSLLGDAEKPGEYTISKPEFRLSTALGNAGARLKGHDFVIVGRKAEKLPTRNLKISVTQLMSGDTHIDLAMRPGDMIIIPYSDKAPVVPQVASSSTRPTDGGEWYIGGASIKRTGVYSIPPKGITLKQAIIAAGGADDGYIRIIRRDGKTQSLVLDNANYSDLSSGEVNDLFIHANDIIEMDTKPFPWKAATTQQTPTP